jgi:hypothetical protein
LQQYTSACQCQLGCADRWHRIADSSNQPVQAIPTYCCSVALTLVGCADGVCQLLLLSQVFGIVAIQLMITVGFACVCLFVPAVKVSPAAANKQQNSSSKCRCWVTQNT